MSVAIIGAGMVGLMLANQLADAEIPVTLFERQLPELTFGASPVESNGMPVRVSAINHHSQQLLKSLACWQVLQAACVGPFHGIQTWVQGGHDILTFEAADLGLKTLGAMIQNRDIIRVLWERAANHQFIKIQCPLSSSFCGSTIGSSLNDLKSRFDLVVGADGGQSWVRTQAALPYHERAYGQQAIVATIQASESHHQTAYQHFLATGPLGVLPLHDQQMVSIVWSADFNEAARLMALDDAAFNIELSNAMNCRLGMMSLASKRISLPLVERHVKTYVADHVVLVGDAAHTIHPLAGQGVNLGFKDADVLARYLIQAKTTGRLFSDPTLLRRYSRERHLENGQMLCGMSTILNGFCRSGAWLQPLIANGIRMVNHQSVLRRFFTRFATI